MPGFSLKIMSLLLMMDLQLYTPFTRGNEKICGCTSMGHPYMMVQVKMAEYLECCIANNSNAAANITWYFKGKQQQTLGKSQHCSQEGYNGDQFLYLGDVQTNEVDGNYTCVIRYPHGSNETRVQSLTVHNPNHCLRGPEFVKIEALDRGGSLLPLVRTKTNGEEDIILHVWRGENITLNCTSRYCGEEWGDHVYWRKYSLDGKHETKVDKENHVHEEEVFDGKGNVFHILHISIEEEEDFGNYTCYVDSQYGQKGRSVIISYRTPVLEIVIGLLVVLIGFLLFLGFLWWHCRIPWLLYYRNTSRNKTGSDLNEFEYDVFIVHGESSCSWVYNVLVPKLEKQYGFSCFLPERDILGGEGDMSAITEKVGRSLRVLVVVTPCVQDELSEKWALLQGYRTALHTNTRIFAIILQNIATSGRKTCKLHKMLDKVTKIRLPPALQHFIPQETYRFSNSELSGAVPANSSIEYPILLSETTVHASYDNFKNSYQVRPVLQNISTSISVEIADLGGSNLPGRLIHQDSSMSETSVPCSPCSTTPFIYPSPESESPIEPYVSGSICACLRVVCCGDTEERFWQHVRLQMHPFPLTR